LASSNHCPTTYGLTLGIIWRASLALDSSRKAGEANTVATIEMYQLRGCINWPPADGAGTFRKYPRYRATPSMKTSPDDATINERRSLPEKEIPPR
tara:strand:- start:50 stop:337 length:288 start_codon:yes stop_codon:yes gene_type:complete